MYLPDFEYYAPASLPEACGLLAQFGPRAKVLAGGTDVLPKMKQEILTPEVLISLKNLSQLTGIYYEKGKGVVIGARATHNDLVDSPVLQEKYLSICEAAHHMANNQIRNTGTIGGNIVNAVPSADLPPILIALGAVVRLAGTGGERTLPLEDFFSGPGKTVISQDEVLTEIIIPDQPFTGSTYIKFGLRRSGALAVVGVAVAVVMEGDICNEARIVLGAVAPVPMRANKAEELLKGKSVTEDLLEKVGVCAAGESKPISDIRGSAEYRQDMVRVFTKRALLKAIKEGHV
ncbi:MAG: Carbon monoxide dehydrogenase medium chain [Pelotomaculum sp. PtaB.Bin013]|uniref:Xanthine dehydrogenase family protein subunit M n=1 Tax=Pelotomaculum isophthalicicum JI TaxID=947010 RepID=A0A9X4H3C4_9FIRM|nr:xanthine dehydrogenase family protein subunit M [Pelotomaculum isophthalicicum]MDF9406842.1 xanthine dehydrogenase family protein subunit M [Pelotomaculum isophthalicicum JI]OPX89662.1 MAG: Carbon monoxide dehydrogenase medium chain [Pelotomaculum sp. PtaB.Bin013]